MKNIIVNSKQIEIIKESVKERLAAERKKVNTNPTDAQCKAENYAMGHICIKGFEITIENPKGSYRRGRDKSGKEWKTYMHNDYGYFTKTVGKDGDAIDVFIGPNIDDDEIKIFPIDQFLNGEFDETKVMMGFRDKESAKSAYLSNYEKDWKGFKYISEVDIDTFKKWLYDGYRQRKPFAKYVSLTESKEIRNDKGEVVPDKCDKCGGEIVLQIHGEPVYICKNCGKYFGTMPFNEKLMNELNESFKSPKLHRMSKENGGLSVMAMNGERSGNEAFKHGYTVPASEITDDMIGDTFTKDDPNYYKKYNNSISFNNGVSAELKNIENLPYVKKPHYWEHTEDNRGWSGMEDRDDFPEINDNQTPFGVGPCYTKVKGKYYQNTDMSRHGANIGDTGRHIPMTESELREKIFEAISDALKNL